MQNTKSYVNSLFNGYEETKNLADFKEELIGHLNDKIENFIKRGLSEHEAFQKATAELGDISALADEMNLKRKQEIISEAFMDIRRFMKPWRVIAYIFFGFVFTLGAICAAIAFFANEPLNILFGTILPDTFTENGYNFLALFGVLFVSVPISAAGYTWLLLTQETSSRYPISAKRALWYAAAALVLCGGIIMLPLTWFAVDGKESIIAALGVLIPFVLPAISLLIFLILTEKDLKKPWVKLLYEKEAMLFINHATEMRFGMFSGAIWITAFALFILFGFIVSFKISWLVFLFATAVQLCVQGVMMKNESK